MAKSEEPITIKKYANRRLYNTGTSTYVTLEDLATMVKNGEEFLVYDAKTGDDITRQVLAQIIFEQEKFRTQMTQAFGGGAFGPLEDQVRRNMELFQQTFSMFKPFTSPRQATPADKPADDAPKSSDDMDTLRRQMREMQEKLDRMAKETDKS